MSILAFKLRQLTGKVRRFVQSTTQDTDSMVALRRGECDRCGACCKILFRCPFLAGDAQGNYSCRIYEHRFGQCRLYPIQPRDMLEVEHCSYTFVTEPIPIRVRPTAEPAE
jgi:uncharacterized protein